MLRDHLIICDSNIPWNHNRYSKHHLMSRLARDNEVVFVNPQTQVSVALPGQDGRWTSVGTRSERPPGEELTVFSPLALPCRGRFPLLQRLDAAFLVHQLRRAVSRHPGRELVLFVGNPYNVFLLDGFSNAACTVYHCSDNFPVMFAGGLRETIARREAELVRRVDLVVCSHPYLVRKCENLGGNVRYLQHAVDERFVRPAEGDPCVSRPPELANLDGPLVGFVGSIDATIDFPLLAEVARIRPQMHFVLVGQSDADHQPQLQVLTALPNVHWLGRKPWAELPAYLWSFDIGIIPFALTDFTAGGSPLKLFEYLAAGLPVVATELEFADELRPLIRTVNGAGEFAAALDAACAVCDRASDRRTRVQAVERMYTWDARARELSELIRGASERRAQRARPASDTTHAEGGPTGSPLQQ